MVRKSPAINTVRNFANEVKNQGVKLRYVYLFGSHARGDQREGSDIDVALVADSFIGGSFEDIRQFIDVTIQKPFHLLEYHTFSTAKFENGDPFAEEIKKNGIRIV